MPKKNQDHCSTECFPPERYFRPNGVDSLEEKIYGAEPTGFLDFNRPRYKWSASIYDLMNANTWFPAEVNTSSEQKNFEALSENEQFIYKMTFAQLSFNDSAQEEYLADFRRLATNKVVKAALTLQMMQEVNHSKSYAVLLDAAGNSEEVFSLYKKEDALLRKNQRIADQFARFIAGNSAEEMLLSAMASVNLEGVYFLTGFSFIYLLGDKVPGARDMIKFIARDEINTHLPLFANIFKTIYRENKIPASIIDRSYEMMEEAVDIELEYGKYLVERAPILGLSTGVIEDTVKNFANDRLKKIGLEPLYPEKPETYLQRLVEENLDLNATRSNFFESNVASYAKNSIDLSDV